LKAELKKVQVELVRIAVEEDQTLVETRYVVASLTADEHSIRSRIFWLRSDREKDRDEARALRREARLHDKLHNEWCTQTARLAKTRKVDVVPRLLKLLDERGKQRDRLQAIPQVGRGRGR